MNTTEHPPTTPDVSLLQLTEYRIYDGLVATGFLICLVIGLPGNCLALRYFLQSKKRTLSNLLYIAACSLDTVSSIIHLPVTLNLLNRRHPGLFGNRHFCRMWYFIVLLVQAISIYVAMLLALTRTIVILFPFYKINKKLVIISIIAAVLYHSTWNTIDMVLQDYVYSYSLGFCTVGPTEANTDFNTLYMINFCLCLGIPPIIVFVSVVVSTARLNTHHLSDASQRRNRQASLTIIYFSTIFLICNSLSFFNNALLTLSLYWQHFPFWSFYNNKFVHFYSWMISEIFCIVLNAALNPLLYLWRMRAMRTWIKNPSDSFTTTSTTRNVSTVSRSQIEASLWKPERKQMNTSR